MNTIAGAVLTAAAVALYGCAAPGTAPRTTVDAADSTDAAATTVRGTARYLERVKMPPGASLRVELIDAASGRPIATTNVRDVGGPPIPFALQVPAARTGVVLALQATLDGANGERWFETPAPVAVPPGAIPVELLMRRVARPGDEPTPAEGPIAHWECGELGVMSRFDTRAGRVRLDYGGRGLTLPLARSASGARYADAAGNEFWTKGATGSLTLAGDARRDCVEAAQASPWNRALLRGAVFRAAGSEPGWSIEVVETPPRLTGDVGYGQRRIDAPVRAVADGWRGTGAAPPLRLHARREACRDAMSGLVFEASVVLDAYGRALSGCGAWLQD